jgi:Transport and Golgi organisation 2
MCTVSIVPFESGFRVACNRDERRTRPNALRPSIHTGPATTSIWPVDPVSGGTWIGVNDAGLVLVVLNRTHSGSRLATSPLLSRGTIVPQLLQTETVQAAIEAATRLDASRFEPYTLLALQRAQACSITVNSVRPTLCSYDLVHPHFFTSSALGDDLAARWRAPLFASLVERSANRLDGQIRFHRHRWLDRPEISVRMSRRDAATVSITTIDVSQERIRMGYSDLSGQA